MSQYDEVEDEPWPKAAGVWTIMAIFTFLAMIVATIWVEGPIGKLWLTWFVLGIVGTILIWCIAFVKEGPGS